MASQQDYAVVARAAVIKAGLAIGVQIARADLSYWREEGARVNALLNDLSSRPPSWRD